MPEPGGRMPEPGNLPGTPWVPVKGALGPRVYTPGRTPNRPIIWGPLSLRAAGALEDGSVRSPVWPRDPRAKGPLYGYPNTITHI